MARRHRSRCRRRLFLRVSAALARRRGAPRERRAPGLDGRRERSAGMTAEEAKTRLVSPIESEARDEAARRVAEGRDQAQRNAERESRKIILLAIQRYASDHVSDSPVSVVHLPSDDMKG